MAKADIKTKYEAARMKFATKVFENKTKILAKYDVLQSQSTPRRKAITHDGKKNNIDGRDLMKGVALCRYLEENFPAARSMLKQMRLNVIGYVGGKLHTPADPEAGKTFNTWAKSCESRQGQNFNEVLQHVVGCVARDGDCLVVFDDMIIGDGKLFIFEADQLVTISKNDWDAQTDYRNSDGTPLGQDRGVIYDSWGRVVAFAVSANSYGSPETKLESATIIPAQSARLIKFSDRPNSYRGSSDLLTAASMLQDVYELENSTVQSAKMQAFFAIAVKRKGGTAPLADLNLSEEDAEALETGGAMSSTPSNYLQLENGLGGAVEYLDHLDELSPVESTKMNSNFTDSAKWLTAASGAGLGLGKSYATLTTDSSYTAFRGDLLMTWQYFYSFQKMIERKLCDWVASKFFEFSRMAIPEAMKWQFPRMPQIDPTAETAASLLNMKNGLRSFSDELGAGWREKIAEAAEQLKFAQESGLPLSAFETVSGAVVEDPKKNSNNQTNGGTSNEEN